MAASIEALDELVTQFCAVTGAEREVAERLLEACNGNLELAIGMHMDQEEATSSSSSSSRPPPAAQSLQQRPSAGTEADGSSGATASGLSGTDDDELNGVRAPIPQRHEVLVEDAPKIPGFRGRGRRRLHRSVFDGFRDFQAEALQQESLMMTGRAFTKKHTLEDLFRPPIDMTYKGTFQSARDFGTSQNKWLLVNLQNVQEFSCQVLNRDIWSNQTIKALVRKHFVFWQVYHDSEEGKKYMQFYKVSQWPHVAVLDPVTGESLVVWNKVEPSSFSDLLNDFLADHRNPENPDGPPAAKRQKRADSIVDASEEAQLEAAIQASLATQKEPAPTAASSSTTAQESVSANSAHISVNSDSECDTDDLETFTGSEDESNQGVSGTRSGSQEPSSSSSSQRRNFSAVSNRTASPLARLGRGGRGSGASSSDPGASGVPSPRHLFSGILEDGASIPSTSGFQAQSRLRVLEDSENDSSQGFRESYANTPNSVEIMGGRAAEVQTIDSSSNSSSLCGSTVVNVDDDSQNAQSCSSSTQQADESEAESSPFWEKYFGSPDDPTTNLLIRFPNGQKHQLALPCTSELKALFLFCSSKGFGQDSYELVVNFPRRTISSLSATTTIKDADLHPQETIFVQAR